MFGNKEYKLSLVKSYVAKWGMVEAVRELIQNALDSSSPFVYEFVKVEGSDTVTFSLTSEFSQLTANMLLLGATSKADNTEAIGSFGEGFKIALLVLTRLGHDVDICNGAVLWKPRFKFDKNFNDDLLTIEESNLPHKHRGLTFHVHGLDEIDCDKIVASCLKMQREIGELKMTSMGDILLDRPGELYVGSLFICKTEMKFGYNIKPEFITLERDRQTVSNWDLQNVTKQMWFETKDYDRIAKLMEADTPDLEYAQYSSPELVKEACYQLFRANNPGAVIAKTNEEMQEKVKQGMTVYVSSSASYHYAVSTSSSYQKENKALFYAEQPYETLVKWLSANRSEMRSKAIEAFKKELMELSKKWKV